MKRVSNVATSLLLASAFAALAACSESAPLTPAGRGRQVYMANCIICHNPDPHLSGSQGPAIAGASRELVEARVLHAAYPPGYTPQRTSKAMPAQPYLAPKLDDLVAFLAEAKQAAK